MAVKNEYELLEKLGRPFPGIAPTPALVWEELRRALESSDSQGRRTAAAKAFRFWRSLPQALKGPNVRLCSGLWTCYYLENNRSAKLDLLSQRFIKLGLASGIEALRAEGLLAKGLGLLASGRVSDASSCLDLSKALFLSSSRNDFDVVRASIPLSSALRLQGNRGTAIELLWGSREICLRIEEVPLLSSVAQTLGIARTEEGDFRAAIEHFIFVRDSSNRLGSDKRALRGALGLASAYFRAGQIIESKQFASLALNEATRLELPREQCLAHEFLGDSYAQQFEFKRALLHYSRVNKILIRSSASIDVAVELHRRLAELWLNADNLRHASTHVYKGLNLSTLGGEKEDIFALRRMKAEIEWQRNKDVDILGFLFEHVIEVHKLGLGYECLLASWKVVKFADRMEDSIVAAEWWGRVEYLAKTCGAEPLLERWRKERQEKGYLPAPVSDALEGESSLNSRLAQELPPVDLSAFNIITRSRQMHEQAASIQQIAPTKVPVLIHGESGTGKELFARLVHDLSPRNTAGFLALNCGALPSELLESELFGHRRGAFTGAVTDKVGLFRAAHNGTLFLDEIGEMSGAAQTKLLRVLEVGELRRVGDTHVEHVDVRIVAATNVDLEDAVTTGKFRRDLYYRLKGLEIFLPPLRERLADIPILAEHFLEISNAAFRKKLFLPFETRQWLMGQPWMGNVRELRLAVERAAALGPLQGVLQPYHFMNTQQQSAKSTLADELEEIERVRVLHALEASRWNKAGAAKLLGMSRTTLLSKIKRLGIEDPESQD